MNKETFLQHVTKYVRSKEARQMVETELNSHLEQSIHSFERAGLSQEEAERKAVEKMGNPEKIGMKMSQLHKPVIDWQLISLFLFFQVASLIPFLFAVNLDQPSNLSSKITFTILGTLIAIGLMFVDYRFFYRKNKYLLILLIIALLISQFFTVHINGYRMTKWMYVRFNSFAFIPLLLVVCAGVLQKKSTKQSKLIELYIDRKRKFSYLSSARLSLMVIFIILSLLYIPINNLPSSLLYLAMCFSMFAWMYRGERKIIVGSMITFLVTVISLGMFIFFQPYGNSLTQRINTYLNPELDISGFQYIQIREMLGQAGWFMNHVHEQIVMPSAYSDFIFTTITYQYGWLVAIGLTLLFIMMSLRIGLLAKKVSDPYGQVLIIGACVLFTFPFIYNIAMSVGLLPIANLSLPFFSYGKLPIIIYSFLIGIVLSVYRRKNYYINEEEKR